MRYDTIQELKNDIKDYMEFYNYKRFCETLDYEKPDDKNYKTLHQIVAEDKIAIRELNFIGSYPDIWGGIL